MLADGLDACACVEYEIGDHDFSAGGGEEVFPVDWDELLNRCLGNRELAQRVLAKFKANFAVELDTMREKLRRGALEELLRLAHRLRGSAANIAAPELTRLMAKVEESATAKQLLELPMLLDQLDIAWQRCRSYQGT